MFYPISVIIRPACQWQMQGLKRRQRRQSKRQKEQGPFFPLTRICARLCGKVWILRKRRLHMESVSVIFWKFLMMKLNFLQEYRIGTVSSVITFAVSIPCFATTARSISPKESFPTFPIKAVFFLEIFVNDGEQVMSATLYTDPKIDKISFFADTVPLEGSSVQTTDVLPVHKDLSHPSSASIQSWFPLESILKVDRKFSGTRRAIVHQRRSLVNSSDGELKLRII